MLCIHISSRTHAYDNFSSKCRISKNPPNRETQVPQYLAVQIQIEILLEFECVPRHFEFFDLVDFGCVAFSVETCHISSSDEHFQWKVSYQLIGEIGCVFLRYGVATISRLL